MIDKGTNRTGIEGLTLDIECRAPLSFNRVQLETIVQPAAPEDAELIAAVHIDCWKSTYAGIVPNSFLESLSQERHTQFWKEAISANESEVLIVKSCEKVKGFLHYGFSRDADRPASAEIYSLYVSPDAQGRGLGRKLLSVAEIQLGQANYKDFTLWVLEKNENARQFYTAAGMNTDGHSKWLQIGHVKLKEIRYAKPLNSTI